MVVKGKKDVDEDMVQRTLLTHVTTHAKELGWTELGLVAGHTAVMTLTEGPTSSRLLSSKAVEPQ